MSSAPTPVPHTPVNFLKGGAAGMFSAACIAAIQKVGLQPEDFGSYDYVAKRLEQKRNKCELYDDAVNGVPTEIPEAQQRTRQAALDRFREDNPPPALPPEPTPHDRRLSESQAGHLTMNSTYQRDRENPCTSVVDGYEDDLAPCMPHHGSTATVGGEHHWVYHNEINQPRERGLKRERTRFGGEMDPEVGQRPPVDPHRYPAADLDADESDRIHRNPKLQHEPIVPQEGQDQPSSEAGQTGSGAQSATPEGAGASGDAAAAGVGDGSDVPAWQKEITGKNAAECIDNFRKAAIAAMKQKCKDELADNKAAATGNSDMTPEQYQQHLQDKIDAANQAGNTRKADRLGRELRAAQHAHCRAQMGQRLVDGNPHVDGRCPAGGRAKARGTTTGPDLIDPSHY